MQAPATKTKPIGVWLDDVPEIRQAAARIDELLRIQATLAKRFPALRLNVVALDEGTLTVATSTAAAAAKFRQSEPSLRSALAHDWPQINRIQFRPQRRHAPAPRPPAEFKAIPPGAADALATLGRSIEASPLRDSLLRLARRGAAGGRRRAGA
ncbi:MAG: hypothetical protein H6934_09580 [Burkholderiaceae bacterium]|nr:hypothetical protein [Burkholderiaceae bacterium]